MEMVDSVTTKDLNCQCEIENSKHFFQRPDLGLLVGLEACRPTIGGSGGRSPLRKKRSYILHVSVEPRTYCIITILWCQDPGGIPKLIGELQHGACAIELGCVC